MTNIHSLLLHYGPIIIFLLLALGIIGIPIPDETIIIIAGVLVSKGKLDLLPTLLATYAGGLVGITLSYYLGFTYGYYLVDKFGYLIGLNKRKMAKAMQWFRAIGKWSLFFGYFVIGIRHLAGLTAGMMKLEYKKFMLFAYSGLFIWATSIFTLGYSFHKTWRHKLTISTLTGLIIGVVALIVIYSFFYYKQKKMR